MLKQINHWSIYSLIEKRKVRPKSIREQKICTLELTQEGIQENNSIKMSTSFNSHSGKPLDNVFRWKWS